MFHGGMDAHGGDLGVVRTPSSMHCCELCKSKPNCGAGIWLLNGPAGGQVTQPPPPPSALRADAHAKYTECTQNE